MCAGSAEHGITNTLRALHSSPVTAPIRMDGKAAQSCVNSGQLCHQQVAKGEQKSGRRRTLPSLSVMRIQQRSAQSGDASTIQVPRLASIYDHQGERIVCTRSIAYGCLRQKLLRNCTYGITRDMCKRLSIAGIKGIRVRVRPPISHVPRCSQFAEHGQSTGQQADADSDTFLSSLPLSPPEKNTVRPCAPFRRRRRLLFRNVPWVSFRSERS
jgi:hypothetical protein